jgi:predicted thioredoxin/glutaredoxin
MATLNVPNVFVDGEVAEASEVNGNFTAVKQFAEGLSDGSNIDANAITAAKLASNSVVESKIASGSVTTAKIADGAVTQAKLDPNIDLGSNIIQTQVFS